MVDAGLGGSAPGGSTGATPDEIARVSERSPSSSKLGTGAVVSPTSISGRSDAVPR